MHYDPRRHDHGLPHDPFNSLVVPRPIAWISTLSETGNVNLAPYSFYNAVSGRPPYVMFSSSSPKDSRRNAERTGEFVINVPSRALAEQMVATSASVLPEVSEPELVGLKMVASVSVSVPRLAEAPAALECRYAKTVTLEDRGGDLLPAALIIGEVVGIYVDDRYISGGRVDLSSAQPLSRLGYRDYSFVGEVFSMDPPP